MNESNQVAEKEHGDSDEQVVQEFIRSRSDRSFARLMHYYQNRVYWTIRRMVGSHDESEEICQMVFITVYEKIDQFNGDSRFFTWLYRIVANQVNQYFRKQRPERQIDLDSVKSVISMGDPSPDNLLVLTEWNNRLNRLVQTLPPQQRLVFTLRYYHDFSYEEIALQTGRTVGALKANYFHAVKKIKEETGHEYPM